MQQCEHDPQSHTYNRVIVNDTANYMRDDVRLLWAQLDL